MTGPDLIEKCSRLEPHELIAFTRSQEAIKADHWAALAFALAAKLEFVLIKNSVGIMVPETNGTGGRR
jgi:hypothetical protein